MEYRNIIDFFKKGYFEYFLEQNITIVHFTFGKSLTFLIYKDEFFIFDSLRSLNKAYAFYNVEKDLCSEGIEYYKISKNYLNYMQDDNVNIKKGVKFKLGKEQYLINHFSKGYKNNKFSLNIIDKKMLYINEFTQSIKKDGVEYTSYEKIAVVAIKKNNEYLVDLYQVESIEAANISNKYKANGVLVNSIENKKIENVHARIGIHFSDGYKDCLQLEENRTGGFLYYSYGEETLQVYKFNTISLEEIYFTVSELFEEKLPLSITTNNDFLYDILKKSFENNLDFILDKANLYNRFVSEFALSLSMNSFDQYKLDEQCLIIQTNFDAIANSFEKISIYDYEYLLKNCIDSYSIDIDTEYEYIDNDFEEFEEDDEIDVNTVDSKLFS